MSYLDSDFTASLQRDLFPGPTILSSLDLDAVTSSLDASKIASNGPINSADRTSVFDLNAGTYTVNDGTVERIRLGRMDDGSYGLIIKDKDGNIILNITGDNNLIQSSNGHMQLDLLAEQLRVYDEANLRILLGKGQNLF